MFTILKFFLTTQLVHCFILPLLYHVFARPSSTRPVTFPPLTAPGLHTSFGMLSAM